jgi:hypothetical protein
VKAFVDEDTGSGLGRALRAVDIDAWYVSKKERISPGTPDEDWIPIISSSNRLIISRNIQMLDSDHQRQLLIDNQSCIVFLPAYLTKLQLLKLTMRKWTWLEWVYDNEPRPFAFQVTAGGTHVAINLHHYTPRRHRYGSSGALVLDIRRPRSRKAMATSPQLKLPSVED